MSNSSPDITSLFKGRFITGFEALQKKLAGIKAYVFDWDGVFNDGFKNDDGSSPFSEVDSMGTNLLRFSHYLRTKSNPVFAVISGEKNTAAFTLAQRENFHVVYFRVKHKADALQHLSATYGLKQEEIAFVFDDVLDLSAAKLAGLRIMVPHAATPALTDFCIRNNLADYISFADGRNHAVREAAELMIYLGGNYDAAITSRMEFSPVYQVYLAQRNSVSTSFYTVDPKNSVQAATL
ncbi:MAG: phosphatase [Bacteroidetes bacterium]|nr:phosphatase [Bacteroidota bacterium]